MEALFGDFGAKRWQIRLFEYFALTRHNRNRNRYANPSPADGSRLPAAGPLYNGCKGTINVEGRSDVIDDVISDVIIVRPFIGGWLFVAIKRSRYRATAVGIVIDFRSGSIRISGRLGLNPLPLLSHSHNPLLPLTDFDMMSEVLRPGKLSLSNVRQTRQLLLADNTMAVISGLFWVFKRPLRNKM